MFESVNARMHRRTDDRAFGSGEIKITFHEDDCIFTSLLQVSYAI